MICAQKSWKKRASSGHANHIFFWKHQLFFSFLPLFYLREQVFFSGLFSDRCTSKTRATACTQRSSEHLGAPLSQAEKASDMVQNLPVGKCAFTLLARHKMSFWMHTWINQSMPGKFLWQIHSGMYAGSNAQEYTTLLYCDIWL